MAFLIVFTFVRKVFHFFTQVNGQTLRCNHTFDWIGGILSIHVCWEGKC